MKTRLFLLAILWSLSFGLSAQSIQKTLGNYCTNSETVHVLTGSCSSYNWSVSGGTNEVHYRIIGSSTSSGFRVQWLQPFTATIACVYICSSGSGTAYTTPFTIQSTVTPSVTLAVNPNPVCQGSNITLTATPTNGGSPTYYWYVDGAQVGSGTANTFNYSTTSLSAGTHSSYVIMNSTVTCVTSTSATSSTQNFTVNAKANYTVDLQGPATICSANPNATFFANVSNGLGTLTYSWYVNGSFATSTSVNYYSTAVANGNTVYCVVSSNHSCVNTPVTSNTYTVTLTSSVTPTVGIQVPKLNYCSGETINFSANGSHIGGGSTYSWRLNGNEFSTQSTTSLPITTDGGAPNAFSPGDVVTVIVSNLTGTCLTSTSATGTTSGTPIVINPLLTPSVSLSVIPTNVCKDNSITLTATPTNGGGSPSYVWYINGGQVGSGSSNTLTYSSASLAAGNHSAYVVMTTSESCVSSSTATSATQNFTATAKASYTATLQGPSLICSSSPTANFFVNVSGGVGNLTYSWYVNSSFVSSGSTNTFSTGVSQGTTVYCIVSSDYWCVNSPVTTNTYTASITSSVTPSVGIQVPKLNYCSGETINFSANGSYIVGGSTYSWRLNGVQFSTQSTTSLPITTDGGVPNAFSPGDVVTVIVSNLSGTCLTSTTATGTTSGTPIVINPLLTPSVTLNVNPTDVCKGNSVSLTATPTNGGTTPTYTWFIDGGQVSSGASNTLNYSTAALTAGSHSVYVRLTTSETCVSATTANSTTQNFTVTNKATYTATLAGPSQICSGSPTANFVVTVGGGVGTLSYAWYVNGVLQTTTAVNMYSTTVSQGTTVYCVVSSNFWCVNSPVTTTTYTANITTTVNPSIGIQVPKLNYCVGETIDFTVNSPHVSGTSTYSWKLNGNEFSTQSATSLPATTDINLPNAFSPGDIVTVTVTNLTGTCLSSTTGTGTTSGTPLVINPVVNPSVFLSSNVATLCQNSPLTFTALGSFGGTTPIYKLYIDGGEIQVSSTGTFTTITNLAPGPHMVYATLLSSIVCATSASDTSNIVNVSVNQLPIVDAGPDRTVILPITTATIIGSISDPDGTVPTLTWTKSSGGSVTLAGTTTATLSLSGLSSGSYTFNLSAADACGSSMDQVAVNVIYPVNNYSYVIEEVATKPGILDTLAMSSLGIGPKLRTINYVDGLGRGAQTVNVRSTPGSQDLTAPIVYDAFGREYRNYLPFSSGNDGWFKPIETVTDASGIYTIPMYAAGSNNYIEDDPYAFSETTYEPSPLNRATKRIGPGSAWRTFNKAVTMQYRLNIHGTATGQEKIVAWKIGSTDLPERESVMPGVVTGGYYASGQLSINVTVDEDGNQTREYTDKYGRVILKKVMVTAGSTDLTNRDQWALTYYLYDGLGNLRFVLPPELGKLIHQSDTYVPSGTDLDNWAFQYKYDSRQRMTEKKVPGAGWVYMVYDWRDRLILTQDANQRSGAANTIKYWSFTKYDELNRPILTGIKDTTISTASVYMTQAEMQAVVNAHFAKAASRWSESYIGNAAGNVHGYTNRAYPVRTGGATEVDPNKYLTVTYYDNYNYQSLFVGNYAYLNENLTESTNGETYNQPAQAYTRIIGQVTGSKVKVLDGGVTGGYTWLKSVQYFDDKYRVIQSIADNYKGGIDRISTLYDFAGKVLETKSTHSEADVTWKDRVGVTQIGNILRRTSGTAGAASVQTLNAGVNGWVEFIISEINTTRYLGFNDSNPDAAGTNINYAFKLTNSTLTVVENNGTAKATITNVIPGDVLRIERIGTVIKYFRNGSEITLSTASTPSSTLLMVDCSTGSANGSFVGVRSSFSTTTRTITRRFEYDQAGRVLKVWHKLDTQPEILLALNTYNELGQLIDKKLHSTVSTGSDAKQSVDYRYNVRGWLTSMNDASLTNTTTTTKTNDDTGDLFGMQLTYNAISPEISNSPLFNGNISGMIWSNNLATGTIKQNAYTYTYDALNRINTSAFKEKGTAWSTPANNALAETGFQYDLNGNIKVLQRNDRRATGWMDNLVYLYTGNRLMRVTDSGDDFAGFIDGQPANSDDYTYDANGNMTRDRNKGIGASLTDATNIITYNFLNLPEKVTKGSNSVQYIYDASGRKLSQVTTFVGQQKQSDYSGEYQYENDVLQFINHEEGRIALAGNKDIFVQDGDDLTNITAVTSTLATTTLNGGQTYVSATAVGTTTKQGMFPIGGTIPVQPGERYLIRAKGYRTGSNSVHLYIRTNSIDLAWPGAALAYRQPAEAFTEQIITIPSGHTSLQAGVVWNTVSAGQQFFLNQFEIIKLIENASPEYQYHLKDHLGNVRLTFTASPPPADVFTATYEDSASASESATFNPSYNNAVRYNAAVYNHTPGGSKSQRLNAANTNEIIGLAKSLKVIPGDTISMEVYAKYFTPTTTNSNVAGLIFGSIQSAFGVNSGTTGDGSLLYQTLASLNSAGALINSGPLVNTNAPKAYINYLLFNDKYALVDAGFTQISESALETGGGVPHQLLQLQTIIKEPGFIYIYLSNENDKLVDVFFDDLKITHHHGPLVQSDSYYPFGLTFNSFRSKGIIENQIRFQGQENINDLDLNWDSFKWRNYQSDIGRFFNIDPLAEKYVHNSTYAFAENKVITFRELEGLEGIHYMEGDKHVIEKNVIVLLKRTDNKPKTSSEYSDNKNARIENRTNRLNRRNARDNAARLDNVARELNQFFGGASNSNGEKVEFKFNITGMQVNDTNGGTDDQLRTLSLSNGLVGAPMFSGGSDQIAPATIVTSQSAATGENNQFYTKVGPGSPEGTLAHEVGHTLMTRVDEENRPGTSGLMGYPPSVITSNEVDKILADSIKKKK